MHSRCGSYDVGAHRGRRVGRRLRRRRRAGLGRRRGARQCGRRRFGGLLARDLTFGTMISLRLFSGNKINDEQVFKISIIAMMEQVSVISRNMKSANAQMLFTTIAIAMLMALITKINTRYLKVACRSWCLLQEQQKPPKLQ